MSIPAGNIYSGDRERAVFTNPTCLAKRKGNVRYDYPVVIDGRTFADAEAAYQFLAADCKADTPRCYEICERVIMAKLRQHPQIFEAIEESGGSEWVARCSHWVGWRKKNPGRWEGDGVTSGFIRCLLAVVGVLEAEKRFTGKIEKRSWSVMPGGQVCLWD